MACDASECHRRKNKRWNDGFNIFTKQLDGLKMQEERIVFFKKNSFMISHPKEDWQLSQKTSPTSPPPLHWNSHDSHIQASVESMSPFVLLIYPEPEGTGSVIPNHATTRHTPLRKSLVSAVQARLITSEVGQIKVPSEGELSREPKAFFAPDLYVLFFFFFFSFIPPT